jgi:hypothetical protein
MIMKICRRRMMDMARIAVLIGDMFEDVEYTELGMK